MFPFKENQLEDTSDMFLLREPTTVPPCEEQHFVIPPFTPAIAKPLPQSTVSDPQSHPEGSEGNTKPIQFEVSSDSINLVTKLEFHDTHVHEESVQIMSHAEQQEEAVLMVDEVHKTNQEAISTRPSRISKPPV